MRKTMLGCVLMAVSLLAVPVFADETEYVPDNMKTNLLFCLVQTKGMGQRKDRIAGFQFSRDS